MLNEITAERSPDDPEQIESDIFTMLVGHSDQRPWAVLEIEREIGSPTMVTESLWHLHAAGLIHRCGEFVWATRAALKANDLRRS
jgi:hypothetical protein